AIAPGGSMPRLTTLKSNLTPLGSRLKTAPSPSKAKRKRGKGLQTRRQRIYLQDPRCASCCRPVLPDESELDHIGALVNGGTDTDDNCQILCIACHQEKTSHDLQQAMARG